ncbi:MAG: ATP-binding protein [Ruminococcaceae bacterium]|nr:ATP-binding protein [Oscillospiraceae bacterium]
MNNQPKIEAFKSFYQQGKDLYNAGDVVSARDSFIKAAELANDISVTSTSYEVRMEYHKTATKILEFVKKSCVKNPPKPITPKGDDSEKTPEIKAEPKSTISFADVAGLEDVKDQIRFKVIEPMNNPELAEIYQIEPGAKILLYGPPGTGKTFIARAIAGEVDAAFYAINCQDLISKYMGDSSKKLDELFDAAQQNERAIIFFDEFDSVASKRGDGSDGVDAEMARFVATFLTKVDGFKKSETNKMLLLIAATNRPWTIDSAMLRGGRFDTHIYVGVPDQEAREFLVNKVLAKLPLEEDVNLSRLASVLEGYGGGDITAICNKIKTNAYMRSIKSGKVQNITREDCNLVLVSSHNMISSEDLEKFEKFRMNGSID